MSGLLLLPVIILAIIYLFFKFPEYRKHMIIAIIFLVYVLPSLIGPDSSSMFVEEEQEEASA
jgi:hypothetical protein